LFLRSFIAMLASCRQHQENISHQVQPDDGNMPNKSSGSDDGYMPNKH
jgi:hypothetical protein